MGTRNLIWGYRQTAGGPLEKLLFLHFCDAIEEHGDDPHYETSVEDLRRYAETKTWHVVSAIKKLQYRNLVAVEWTLGRLFVRIPFPDNSKAPPCQQPAPSSP